MEIKIRDKSFLMCGPSSGTGSTGKAPKKMKWYDGPEGRDITVFTDLCLTEVNDHRNTFKIALLLEPRSILKSTYEWIEKNHNLFDLVLTHDKQLMRVDETKFAFCPTGCGHWIPDDGIKIHTKSKNVSMFISEKVSTIGHNLRYDIRYRFHDKIDGIFGKAVGNYIKRKIDGLRDYRFHIAVENAVISDYFTEKLIDPIITGCIPIYYGCPHVEHFFNPKGILQFNNIKELNEIFEEKVNEEYYNELLKSGVIEENFNIALERFLYPEDLMYEVFFEKISSGLRIVKFDLKPNDIVVDIGGYHGIWAKHIYDRYKCRMVIFEPVREYYEILTKKFKGTNAIIGNYGLHDRNDRMKMILMDDATTLYAYHGKGLEAEEVDIRDVSVVFTNMKLNDVALLHINAEGVEYAIINRLIKTGMINNFKEILVQYHNILNVQAIKRNTREQLEKSHKSMWEYQSWELWRKK